jgi:hypothetical protein
MRSAEKNDVDITKLFRYKTEVEVKDELTGDSGKLPEYLDYAKRPSYEKN